MAKPKKKKVAKKVKKIKPIKKGKVLAKKKVKRALVKKKVAKKVKNRKVLRKKPSRKLVKKAKKVIAKNKAKKAVKKPKVARIKKSNLSKPKAKPVVARQEPTAFAAEALFKARIKVVGIGGGGGSIVSEIGKSLEKATFVVADTDVRALKKRSGIKYFLFGQEMTHGLGTGVDVELAKKAAESSREKAGELFKDQDIVIFVASLGGGLGSGATQVFAETARKFGGITFGIFTMPFKFEGANKHRIALNALKSLKSSLNVSMVIPNEKIFKIIDENTPITDAFSMVNKSLIESLESLINLIYSPGIINIDFADLKTILKGVGNSAFLNTVVESGKDRAEKICKEILVNPLLQSNSHEAEKILFNITGSENLSMFEVEKISTHIANLHPKAKIIFGISKSSKLKNKIKTTILMTGGGAKERIKAPETKEEPVVEEVVKAEAVKVPEKQKLEIKKPEEKKIPQPEKKAEIKTKKPVEIKKPKLEVKRQPESIPERQSEPSLIPVAEVVSSSVTAMEQRKMMINQLLADNKKTIRRSALEVKKAEEKEEKKRIAQEKEWEIPAFLRRVKKV